MSEILESSTWESNIYRISKEDLVLGGAPIIEDGIVISGVANIASQQLTNRTNYLKNRCEVNSGAITALNIAMATANSNIATAIHRLDILEPIVSTITASVVLAADDARTSAQTAQTYASNAGVSAAAASVSASQAAGSATASVAAQAAAVNAGNSATSATNAGISATSATGSKNAAAISETNAAASAAAASSSATAANGSKTAAATSATNAGNSATAAAGSASDAATSATSSETSRTNAAASASVALTFRNNAQTSATNAGTSETNAAASAATATAAATSAATSATAASGSKDAALGSANNAAASAIAADTSKTAAATSATNAAASAVAAAASAAEALANSLPHYKGLFSSLVALLALPTTGFIAGDYADVDEGVGIDSKRYLWDTSDTKWVTSSGGGGGGEALTAPQVKVLYESNPNTNAYTDAEKAKLGGVATGATANDTDANLKNRANHTGSQAIATITGLQTALNTHDTDIIAAKNRANHTGTQAISTITGLQTALDSKAVINDGPASLTTTFSSTEINRAFNDLNDNLALTNTDIWTELTRLDTVKVAVVAGKGLSTNDYTTTEKTKLGGIATGATVNDTDANLKNRANHTGTQAISTITGLQAALDAAGGGGAAINDSVASSSTTYSSNHLETVFTSFSSYIATVVSGYQTADLDLDGRKVEKVAGKQLSTEDYTTVEKAKLASISTLLTPLVATTTVSALAAAGNSIVNLSGALGANNLVLEVDVVSTGSYTVEFYNSTNATGTLLYKAQLITGNYNDRFSYYVTAGTPALSMKITNNGTSALTATAKFTYIKLA